MSGSDPLVLSSEKKRKKANEECLLALGDRIKVREQRRERSKRGEKN